MVYHTSLASSHPVHPIHVSGQPTSVAERRGSWYCWCGSSHWPGWVLGDLAGIGDRGGLRRGLVETATLRRELGVAEKRTDGLLRVAEIGQTDGLSPKLGAGTWSGVSELWWKDAIGRSLCKIGWG